MDNTKDNKRITRKYAIRYKCIDCMAGSKYEVRLCPSKECPLWRFRLGKEIKDTE